MNNLLQQAMPHNIIGYLPV